MYFNESSIIKETIIIGNNTNKKNEFNIAYGIDKKFFLGCAVSIFSILLTNPLCSFSFHIFTNHIDTDFQNKLRQVADEYNTCITVYLVNDAILTQLPTTKNWTIATYFRFIIADYFYAKINKILYIDADIICKGSLQELFQLNIDDTIACVVEEKDAIWWKKCANRLNEDKLSLGYFNAGFLLINLNKWQESHINSKAFALLKDDDMTKKLTHLDQDVLNLLLIDNIKFLDKKYNQHVNINYELKYQFDIPHFSPVTENTILIHYIGPTKPWHSWAESYACSSYFLNTKTQSPWKLVPLLSPTTSTQLRYCAKHKLHQKKFFDCLFYYIKYYIYNIKVLKMF